MRLPTLISHLERISSPIEKLAIPVRFPVQGSRTEKASVLRGIWPLIAMLMVGFRSRCYLETDLRPFRLHTSYLIMRFQSVKVVSIFSLSCTPAKPNFVNLRRKHRQVGFEVAIQEVWHYNPIGHHMNHHVPNPRKEFHLREVSRCFERYPNLILCQPYGEVLDRPDQPNHILIIVNSVHLLTTLR